MKIWLPAIQGRSGADVFTLRLCEALRREGCDAEISWFPNFYELFPFLLRGVPPPPGTAIIHANSWNAFAFKRKSIPLVVTEQLGVLDPAAQAPQKRTTVHLPSGGDSAVPQSIIPSSLGSYRGKRLHCPRPSALVGNQVGESNL